MKYVAITFLNVKFANKTDSLSKFVSWNNRIGKPYLESKGNWNGLPHKNDYLLPYNQREKNAYLENKKIKNWNVLPHLEHGLG